MTDKTSDDIYKEACSLVSTDIDQSLRMKIIGDKFTELMIHYGFYTRNDIEAQAKVNRKRILAMEQSKEDYEPKRYITLDLAKSAYAYILGQGGKPIDAYTEIAPIHGEKVEDIKDMANRGYYYSKDVVKHFDDNAPVRLSKGISQEEHTKLHNKQKDMSKKGTLPRTALKKASTLNNQLNELSKGVTLHETLTGLEEKVDILENNSIYLEGKVELQGSDISTLKEITGMEELPNKEKAKILRSKGFTQKVVADMLEVSLSTIKRWEKENG